MTDFLDDYEQTEWFWEAHQWHTLSTLFVLTYSLHFNWVEAKWNGIAIEESECGTCTH